MDSQEKPMSHARITVCFIAVMLILSIGLSGCGSNNAGNDMQPESRPTDQLMSISFNEPVAIDGSQINKLMGQPDPEGEVIITFEGVDRVSSVEDYFTGKGSFTAQGEFVAVYYSIENDLLSKMQPSTQLNDDLVVQDAEGRTWECADYRPPNSTAISGNFATSKGYSQPETWVDPGFTNQTAVAFDIPKDTKDIYLVSKRLGFRLPLQ